MSRKKKWFIEWNDDYLTGMSEIDNFHKELIDSTKLLYEYYLDTKRYSEEICDLTGQMGKKLIEHMSYEDQIFETNNISGRAEHKKEHDDFRREFFELNNFGLPCLLKAFMVNDLVLKYFKDHFLIYDVRDIKELNMKADINIP